jgi:hypothetical protein
VGQELLAVINIEPIIEMSGKETDAVAEAAGHMSPEYDGETVLACDLDQIAVPRR